ncbi:MAG: winged helix-turn-helix transcriptional regulator [Limnochordaceae bacterium]|nr:winged helix-turn-helix transcriptional regulator [Limnochordaceae bacterium]
MPAPSSQPEPTPSDLCRTFAPDPDRVAGLQGRLVEVAGLSELFRALADESRVKILYLLSLQELCVCDLAQILGLTLPAISHHLRLLKAMRLVKFHRQGRMVYYSLRDNHIVELIRVAREHFLEGR